MKPKVSAAKKIADFHISPYIRRPIRSQFGCLALALAVLALPFAGIRIKRGPILTPLATELVALGTSLESPLSTDFNPPSLVAPNRIVLGLFLSTVLAHTPDPDDWVQNLASPGFPDSGAFESPHGRSPPSF